MSYNISLNWQTNSQESSYLLLTKKKFLKEHIKLPLKKINIIKD